MYNNNNDAVAVIDRKIEEVENELKRLREEAETIPTVEANLAALKRTRSILTGNQEIIGRTEHSTTDVPAKSIGALLMDILQEHGKSMHVDDALPKLRERGCNANRNTVIGTLVRYMQAGKVRRTKPNTYAAAYGKVTAPDALRKDA